jgi:DNA recombination protein RmuC
MTSYCDFTEQTSEPRRRGHAAPARHGRATCPTTGASSSTRRRNTYAYVEAVNAQGPTRSGSEHLDRFAARRDQAKKLGDKKLLGRVEGGSPEFVVMFVPGDHFIDAALQRRPTCSRSPPRRNVILASPATLIGCSAPSPSAGASTG